MKDLRLMPEALNSRYCLMMSPVALPEVVVKYPRAQKRLPQYHFRNSGNSIWTGRDDRPLGSFTNRQLAMRVTQNLSSHSNQKMTTPLRQRQTAILSEPLDRYIKSGKPFRCLLLGPEEGMLAHVSKQGHQLCGGGKVLQALGAALSGPN